MAARRLLAWSRFLLAFGDGGSAASPPTARRRFLLRSGSLASVSTDGASATMAFSFGGSVKEDVGLSSDSGGKPSSSARAFQRSIFSGSVMVALSRRLPDRCHNVFRYSNKSRLDWRSHDPKRKDQITPS
jgi:hypothetical protein